MKFIAFSFFALAFSAFGATETLVCYTLDLPPVSVDLTGRLSHRAPFRQHEIGSGAGPNSVHHFKATNQLVEEKTSPIGTFAGMEAYGKISVLNITEKSTLRALRRNNRTLFAGRASSLKVQEVSRT